ncbi:MAG: dimethylargininase [Acidobacteria bacterium]|nr:MAG: dimethylargininase [Acidobacteriota bacterium]
MMMAITRDVSPALERCELTHLPRTTIDVGRARMQHAAYEQCLIEAVCPVERLVADATMPDSVFVEDIAVVFDELALITRPGAASRRVETPAVADALARYRTLRYIESPGCVDGGDVLVVGEHVFVGQSTRTNAAGIEQMRHILDPYGYTVEEVEVTGCLHLKSAVTALTADLLLMNRAWTDADRFARFTIVDVDPAEPLAANALPIGGLVIFPAAFPRTERRLAAQGFHVRTVDVSEFAKAEGGVTCCSLVFDATVP